VHERAARAGAAAAEADGRAVRRRIALRCTCLVLLRLHIAAYMAYIGEVRRLIESGGEGANSNIRDNAANIPHALLERIMGVAAGKGRPWPEDALADAQEVIEYLKEKEELQVFDAGGV
jgi:hypothetical protein